MPHVKHCSIPEHKLKTPNAKTLDEMSNVELKEVLKKAREDSLSIRGNVAKKNIGFGGMARQNRITIARCLTILQKRGA